MGRKLDKFLLLMWKNWVLQYRRPVQTIIEIATPVVFCMVLVIIRSLSAPNHWDPVVYNAFSPIPEGNNASSNRNPPVNTTDVKLFGDYTLIYSPRNEQFDTVMKFFNLAFKEIKGLKNSTELESYFISESTNSTFAGIDFGDDYRDIKSITDIRNLNVSIRFPGEIRIPADGEDNWRTNRIYPVYQSPGPRMPEDNTGGAPRYHREGFLALQYSITAALILASKGLTPNITLAELEKFVTDQHVPVISMRRFPHAAWYWDPLLAVLKSMIGINIMLSFVYSSINITKSITIEKEKQLKEAMKIMGLPNWLHWMAWFVKCFVFLLISSSVIVLLLKIKWYKGEWTVFTNSDPSVMFLFLIFYIITTITFCFLISVFFSKANTAATIAGLAWFMSYAPYLFMQRYYDKLTLYDKLFASLAHNTGMAFGFQIMIMYEGTGEGVQWNNIFTPNTPDDTLTLGLTMVMLAIDSMIYILLALYIEAVMPGEYGVAQPWCFPFKSSYWFGQNDIKTEDKSEVYSAIEGEMFEPEPKKLKAGIQMKNLCKIFGKKIAVRNFSLNMYENQITVLLGHNGAGKTTTMSMLTGMITPSSGKGKINGCDLGTNMEGVRESLGLCPQHNIIFDDLTVAEHIYFFSKLKGFSKREVKREIDKYVDILQLQPKRNARASTLSGGMKRKLCVAIALCGNSKVIMLDEPTAGMDPSARRALWNLLKSQIEGRTMLLTTHFMDEADLLGDRIAIMVGGELQCCGSSFFLKKKYGAGYSLIMNKTKDCNAERVTHLLRKFIPDIKVHSNVGSELIYLMEDSKSAVFEPLLQELERQSEQLGVIGYGISLTTLEEVFMRVGAGQSQEEMIDGFPLKNGQAEEKTNEQTSIDGVDVLLSPYYTVGFGLVLNQFRAMLMKRLITTFRSWIILCIQVLLPSIFLIVALILSRRRNSMEHLPPLPLNLQKFKDSITLVQTDGYDYGYSDLLRSYGYTLQNETNITRKMLKLTEEDPITVRRRYIIGASFENVTEPKIGNIQNITAWYNNDAYHSPGISLALVLNAVYQKLFDNCINCSIEFTNHPFPYTVQTQFNQLLSGQSTGFQLSFTVAFSMSFVSAYFVIFIVKEIACGSKHLQFVSGVGVFVFWITNILCDFLTYIATVALFLSTLLGFQEGGYNTPSDICRLIIILLIFVWAFLPLTYIAGYLFDDHSTGYSRMTLFGIFTGNVAFMVVQMLSYPDLNLQYLSEGLHVIFLLLPHYSLISAISESYNMYAYNIACDKIFETCYQMHMDRDACLASISPVSIRNICRDHATDYFKWESPGIGRNVLYSTLMGLFLYILLFTIEFGVFSRFLNRFEKGVPPSHNVIVLDEDSDVADEKKKIRNATQMEIASTYSLAFRDLTKYYDKLLAVNELCLGVKKYECFGLLGVNGAGKTTTFKMISGDVKMSYGDAWVNGKSIDSQLKEVQKAIGYCPQFDALLDDMTPQETIVIFSLLRGIRLKDAYEVAQFLAVEFDFERHLKKKVKELSGGNKRKLSTAISLIGDPPVLYLDEPTTGMDPATKRHVWNALCKSRDSGKCIILTSHSMEECEALCTRIAIMVNGSFRCLGSTQHLKNKFAEGYALTIKMRKSSHQYSGTERIEEFIEENFPGAQVREMHQELINYYITDTSIAWSKMFGILERAKRTDLNIEDYSIGQSSLEQVFLTFTRNQNQTS